MKIMSFSFIFLVLLGCSGTTKNSNPFGTGLGLESIPDEFDQKKGKKSDLFIDKTDQYGLFGVKAFNFNLVDLNSDGYTDLVTIPSFYSLPEFFLFDPFSKKFKKVESFFKKSEKVSFLVFADLNQDNVTDVIAGVLNQNSELSKKPLKVYFGIKKENKLDHFRLKQNLRISTPIASIGLIDYNLDGKLDIFVGNWLKKEKDRLIPNQDYLFVNNGKVFKNTSSLLLEEGKQNVDKTMFINATPTYGVQICDLDQNGFPDIITTSTNRYQNKLWMNQYKFREKFRYFQNYGMESGVAGDPEGLINTQGGGRSFAVACADYNNDEIMDVFMGELSHNYDDDSIDKSSLLTGRTFKFPPKFYRTEYFLDADDPNWHQADRRAIWADLNNDGLQDLIVDNSGYPPLTKLIIFEQQRDHSFTNRAKEYGVDLVNPISTVVGDFNKDGRLDILTARSTIRDESLTNEVFLFENNMPLGNRKSIRFHLRGKKSNTQGLNATVILKVKNPQGVINYRKQNVSYSYGALPPQNEEGVHFGLDEGEEPIWVKVIWPYSKSLNQNKAGLERLYKIELKFVEQLNLVLCETGELLVSKNAKCKL